MIDERPEVSAEDEFEAVTLTRDAILNAEDLPIESVEIPEWGGSVFVRTMTGRERDAFEVAISGGKGKKTNMRDFRARLAVMTVCDGNGERLFDQGDTEALSQKSGSALDRVFDVARRLNRIGEDEQRDLIENFDDAPSGDSGSD
jgi:hypothetical protein